MKINQLIALAAAALLGGGIVMAQENVPQKREMRSTWVATVWQLDWPQSKISISGDESQINKQKKQMTQMLDSLQMNNFNAINFQVRSRADAFYKSSYEPWSADLCDKRGMDPGYDPLEFVVEECHKRGMECHAWLNPYRYESQKGQWNGTPRNYRELHPDWIMDVGSAAIFNPGKQEVEDFICDIIREIVTNYDVDGVLFDDYFYLSGVDRVHDGDLYDAYVAGGGKLEINDWRRDNVNRMIAAVYRTIKSTKPWVRFGVSPAGVACTATTVAAKHGVPVCPVGSDWQYNDIKSDPLAWISQQSLDFISPQIYWAIGSGNDYRALCKWWSMIANKWQRHFYASHSISSLTTSPSAGAYQEFADEIALNREYNYDDAPGSIFYSAKYLYRMSPKFGHYLYNHVFKTKALMPALTWQKVPAYDTPVSGMQRSGSTLTWQSAGDNLRYSVYAYPANIDAANFAKEPEYLLGITYEPQYTIPSTALTGMQYAVCIYDRYGNEYSPALLGVPTTPLDAPVATYPVGGASVEAPFIFEWQPVAGASEYIIEVCYDEAMTQRIDQRATTATNINSSVFYNFPTDRPVYWRVRACGAGKIDGLSAVEKVNISHLLITSPCDGDKELALTPTITYSIPEREVTLEIATKDTFTDNYIVYSTTTTGGSITVPKYALCGATTYYARMRYIKADVEMITPVVSFTTVEYPVAVPSIAFPVAGDVFHADQCAVLAPIEGPSQLRFEIAETEAFPARTSYVALVNTQTFTDKKTGAEVKVSSKNLVDGKTYYARVNATFRTENGTNVSDYSTPITFTYSAQPSGIDNVTVDNAVPYTIEGTVLRTLTAIDALAVYNMQGRLMATYNNLGAGVSIDMPLVPGSYIIKADGNVSKQILNSKF